MNQTAPVLLVEDDEVDILTVRRALKELRVQNPLVVTSNGEEALTWLYQSEGLTPTVILLDLNMPRMNGFEFLEQVKQQPPFSMIPVIVLTTSNQPEDRKRAFALAAAGYMVKPVDYHAFVELMQTIHIYWSTERVD